MAECKVRLPSDSDIGALPQSEVNEFLERMIHTLKFGHQHSKKLLHTMRTTGDYGLLSCIMPVSERDDNIVLINSFVCAFFTFANANVCVRACIFECAE